MKKLAICIAVIVGVFGALGFAAKQAGLELRYATEAPNLMVGFAGKMACSLRYVSGFDDEQISRDLEAYSPLFLWPSLNYDDSEQRVTASWLGTEASFHYREGAGCTIGFAPLPAVPPRLYADWQAPESEADPVLSQRLKELILIDQASGQDTRALLVMRADGRILGEAYAEGFNADTRFLGWSMSKTLTAIMIGSLQYRGVMPAAMNGPLFDAWQNDDRKAITLEHLLTSTSGLEFEETYQPGADATRMLFEDTSVTHRSINKPLEYKPGEHWSYSSGTANLLSALIFKRFGENPEAQRNYLDEYVLYPLGFVGAVLEEDVNGVYIGSSFTYATARAWATMGALFLNNGAMNGYQIVTPQFIRKAVEPNMANNDSRYGYQLWLNQGANNEELKWPSLPTDSFAARGSKGQVVMVVPEYNLVIARLGWSKEKYPVDQAMATILDYLPRLQ